MGFLPSNIFGQKKSDGDAIEPEVKVATPAKPVRGPDGKFIGKNHSAKPSKTPNTPKEETEPAVAALTPAPAPVKVPKESATQSDGIPTVQMLTFYGTPIKKIQHQGVWFFSLLDILTMAHVIYPAQLIVELKENSPTKTVFKEAVIDLSSDNLNFLSYDGFLKLLPALRTKGVSIPGPFPDWLKSSSL